MTSGGTDAQFEPLAAHVLDQDGEVQLAAPGDAKLVRIGPLLDAQRHIMHQLLLKAFLDLARGDKLAVLAGEWANC
jgi:hypothetical protein